MPEWFTPVLILIVIAMGFLWLVNRKPKPARRKKGKARNYEAIRDREYKYRVAQLERELREMKQYSGKRR